MPVETSSLFAQVIQEHLELKQRNARLEGELPIDRYKSDDPFENHPLFKTEEQARLEETMDGEVSVAAFAEAPEESWPGDAEPAPAADEASGESTDSGLWSRSRDFDWGD